MLDVENKEVKTLVEYNETLVFYGRKPYKYCMRVTFLAFDSLSLSLRFHGHFPGEPGLAGVY